MNGPIGLIKVLLETFLDALNPYPDKKNEKIVGGARNETGCSAEELSNVYAETENDPGKKYWQELLEQRLDEKERESEITSEMIMNDYEARHQQNSSELENAESGEPISLDGDFGVCLENDFDSSCDSDDSGDYDGYIG